MLTPIRPHAVAALAALLVMAALSGCGSHARAQHYLERGRQSLEKGNIEKASVDFRSALQIEPKSAPAQYFNGRVAELRGAYAAAVRLYQGALDSDPSYLDARVNLARLYALGGEPEKALDLIRSWLANHAPTSELLAVRAAARERQHDVDGAHKDAIEALRLDPNNTDAVALLAGLASQAGDYGSAITLVQGVLERRPQLIDLRDILVRLYVDSGQPQRAEGELRKLIDLQPDLMARRYALTLFYQQAGRLDDAQHVLEDAVRAAPTKVEPKLALAQFVWKFRSPADGRAVLTRFIAAEPSNLELRLGAGSALQAAGAPAEAMAMYHEVVQRDPKGPQGVTARERIGQLDFAQGRLDTAAQDAAEVLQLNPRDNDALLLRANLELRRRQDDAAVQDLRALARDQPSSVPVRKLLATAYIESREPALAQEQLTGVLQTAPDDAAARIQLAQLLGESGQGPEAVRLIQDGLTRKPDDPDLNQALARAQVVLGDTTAASAALAKLGTLVPAGSPILALLAGQIALAAGKPAEAASDFEQALKAAPTAIEPLAALTRLDLHRDRAAQAVERIRSTLPADPENPFRLNLLAEALNASGHPTEAVKILAALVTKWPTWPVAYHNLAGARVLAGDVPGAIEAYQAGLKAVPFEPELTLELAGLYERQGDIDSALAQIEALLNHSSDNAAIHARAAGDMALLLVDHRTDPASLDRARDLTAAFVSSADPVLLDTFGWVHYRRGDNTEALSALERASGAAPRSATTLYHLAMAQLKAGDSIKARSNLESALAHGEGFRGGPDARVALGALAQQAPAGGRS